jgi:phage terminase large subunit-like protein
LSAIPGYDPFVHAEGCWFDAKAADFYVGFIETCCTHIEGPMAGQRFLLETWEKAIVGNLFGWYTRDSAGRVRRRYSEAFIYVPRKNGKTPLAAAIACAVLYCDEEMGQQNYCLASEREQAGLLFLHMKGMIEAEPEMRKRVQIYHSTKAIEYHERGSYMKVLSGESQHKSGRNSNLIIIDELHEIEDRDLVVKMTTSTSSQNRLNPLVIYITTADYDRESICNEKYEYACQVRDNGGHRDRPGYDPAFLPVIYEAMHRSSDGNRVEDDWTREDTWYKANPNLGVSVSLDWFRREVGKAKQDPTYALEFKRYHLNIRSGQKEHVIDLNAWDACRGEIDWESFKCRMAYGALDIGSWRDFTAFTLVWPHDDGEQIEIFEDPNADEKDPNARRITILRSSLTTRSWFWLPERPRERDARMKQVIDGWSAAGWITRTPGDEVDYDQVAADIVRIVGAYQVPLIGVDTGWQAHHSCQDLMKHLGANKIAAVKQGVYTLGAPFRELQGLIAGGTYPVDEESGRPRRLYHDGNPVMRWMASNTVGYHKGGRVSPDKDKSTEKIDGIVALTMAVYLATTSPAPAKSVYETRGIRTL